MLEPRIRKKEARQHIYRGRSHLGAIDEVVYQGDEERSQALHLPGKHRGQFLREKVQPKAGAES